jgi:hypothetical protein
MYWSRSAPNDSSGFHRSASRRMKPDGSMFTPSLVSNVWRPHDGMA